MINKETPQNKSFEFSLFWSSFYEDKNGKKCSWKEIISLTDSMITHNGLK